MDNIQQTNEAPSAPIVSREEYRAALALEMERLKKEDAEEKRAAFDNVRYQIRFAAQSRDNKRVGELEGELDKAATKLFYTNED